MIELKDAFYIPKQIVQYPNYIVFKDGTVYNIKAGSCKKWQKNNSGYYRIALWKKNKRKRFFIHRLVAFGYLERPNNPDKNEVDHIKNNKSLNNVGNLQWVTRQENMDKVYSDKLDESYENCPF